MHQIYQVRRSASVCRLLHTSLGLISEWLFGSIDENLFICALYQCNKHCNADFKWLKNIQYFAHSMEYWRILSTGRCIQLLSYFLQTFTYIIRSALICECFFGCLNMNWLQNDATQQAQDINITSGWHWRWRRIDGREWKLGWRQYLTPIWCWLNIGFWLHNLKTQSADVGIGHQINIDIRHWI